MDPDLHEKYRQRVIRSLKHLHASYHDILVARHEHWDEIHRLFEQRVKSIHRQILVTIVLVLIFGLAFGLEHLKRFVDTRETEPLLFSLGYLFFMVIVSSAFVYNRINVISELKQSMLCVEVLQSDHTHQGEPTQEEEHEEED